MRKSVVFPSEKAYSIKASSCIASLEHNIKEVRTKLLKWISEWERQFWVSTLDVPLGQDYDQMASIASGKIQLGEKILRKWSVSFWQGNQSSLAFIHTQRQTHKHIHTRNNIQRYKHPRTHTLHTDTHRDIHTHTHTHSYTQTFTQKISVLKQIIEWFFNKNLERAPMSRNFLIFHLFVVPATFPFWISLKRQETVLR